MKRIYFFLLFTFYFSLSHAQRSLDARKIIDTLTSATMDGRCYLNEGDLKAANFIRDEFSTVSLKPFYESYFQHFNFDVNTFPERITFAMNTDTLQTGVDFILNAWSGSAHGIYFVQNIDSSLVKSKGKQKKLLKKANAQTFLVFSKQDFRGKKYQWLIQSIHETQCFGYAGIIEVTNEKLTMDMSEEQMKFAHIIVRAEKVPQKLQSISIQLDAQLKTNYQTQNVIGYIEGSEKPDSFLVFTAHYDHLGQLGDGVYFPGANDNASGISMLIELAKYFSLPEHKPKYSILFIAFSGEEVGLLGSKYFTEHPLISLSRMKFLVNMDIVGTGDEGIKVVNGAILKDAFNKLVQLNDAHGYLKSVQSRGKAANSDHYFFFEKGVPAFFIYTLGGIGAYHDVFDKSATLPLTKYDDLLKLLIDFEESF